MYSGNIYSEEIEGTPKPDKIDDILLTEDLFDTEDIDDENLLSEGEGGQLHEHFRFVADKKQS